MTEQPAPQETFEDLPNATENLEPSTASESHDTNTVELLSLIQKLTAEREQLNEQLLRTMADFQNFRKRNQQELQINRQYATEALVSSLLPVLDNFERTVIAAENGATIESVTTGVRAVEKQLRFLIEQQGVSRIQSIGLPFDANFHEAVGTVENSDHPADTVVEELEPGYKMGEKVIRPARVRVSVSA